MRTLIIILLATRIMPAAQTAIKPGGVVNAASYTPA
jgi:hypothetical protein